MYEIQKIVSAVLKEQIKSKNESLQSESLQIKNFKNP